MQRDLKRHLVNLEGRLENIEGRLEGRLDNLEKRSGIVGVEITHLLNESFQIHNDK